MIHMPSHNLCMAQVWCRVYHAPLSQPLLHSRFSLSNPVPCGCREKYSKEADIWSAGVVLFIALGGYAPFDGSNEREVCCFAS